MKFVIGGLEVRGWYHVQLDLIAGLICEQIRKDRSALVGEQDLQYSIGEALVVVRDV